MTHRPWRGQDVLRRLARLSFALVPPLLFVALPLVLLGMLAISVGYRWFFVISGGLSICGWIPLAILLYASGQRGWAVVLAVVGNAWALFMAFSTVMGAEPSGEVRPSHQRELAEAVVLGGAIGALADAMHAARRWRTRKRAPLVARVLAAALAAISFYPVLAVAATVFLPVIFLIGLAVAFWALSGRRSPGPRH